ncbi:MAG TPA: oligosaccharide flippase family protein [Chloroflexota bacterium]
MAALPIGTISDVAAGQLSGSQRRTSLVPAREGAFWVLLTLALPRAVGAVVTVLLRRVLGPAVSGTFDLALTPYQLFDGFRTIGTGPALVYKREMTAELANTAWVLNMLGALLVAALAQLLAHPVAAYYGHPAIENIFRVLAVAYVFTSVSSVHYFLLLRARNFRARSIPAIGQVVVATVLALLLALWGFGVGALVAREIASAAAGAVLLWAVYPFRPRIQLIPELARELLSYGIWISAAMTLLFVSQNVDVFIGGRIIRSTADIGFYTTSWSVAFIAAGIFTALASSLAFPSLSRLQDDAEALRRMLLKAVRQLMMCMLPAGALLAVLAPVFIVPVLGEKWEAYRSSFMVLSLLSLYAANRTVLAIFFEGYKSIGKPWIIALYNGAKLAIMIPAMILGARHGVLGLAVTYVPIQLVEVPVSLLLARKVLHVAVRDVWQTGRAPVIASAGMCGVVVIAEAMLLNGAHLADASTLLVCGALGVVTYLGLLALLDRSVLREGWHVILSGL